MGDACIVVKNDYRLDQTLRRRGWGLGMKMYFLCDGNADWWVCHGFLDNGFYFGQHVCSHPCFAPDDLYFRRQERVSALKEIFGIDPDQMRISAETIIIRSKDQIPDWVNNEETQKALEPQYEKYKELLNGPIPESKVEIEVY